MSHLKKVLGTLAGLPIFLFIFTGCGGSSNENNNGADTIPPVAITDLVQDSFTLNWTAPGDDGTTGTAASYDIRYSTTSITEGNWNSAMQLTGEPAPQSAGSTETFTVTGLSTGTTYYLAIKTTDEIGNESGLSNLTVVVAEGVNSYYVSDSGAASWADCRSATPLSGASACSPSMAMTNVKAGDTVYFRGGDYYPPDVTDPSFPSWYPRESGTNTNSIIIKAYTGETATIYQPNTGAPIGVGRYDYSIWDGFILVKTQTTEASSLYLCYMGDNNTIRNSEFIGNVATDTTNQVGAVLSSCSNSYIHNNIFRDFTATSNVNSGAMWLFDYSNAYVFNNDFYDSDNGVQTKDSMSGIYAHHNFFRGVARPFHWQQQNPAVRDFYIYNNVAVLPSDGVFLYAADPAYEYNNTQVYNNTIYCSSGCTAVFLGNNNTRTSAFWNNIIYGASGTTMFEAIYSGAGMPDYMDYNNYYTAGTANWRFNVTYSDFAIYTSMTNWQTGSGFDNNSVTTDPDFINPGGTTPESYKRTSYPANGRGGPYASVMGAYITGNEIIGVDY